MNHKKLIIDYTTPLKTQLQKLGIQNHLDLGKITCLLPHTETISDVEDGEKMMGKSPENCEKEFTLKDRRGLCIHEGLALLRKDKKLLKHHYIDLVGSRYGNCDRVPHVYFDFGDQPKLNGHYAVSAAGRWGSPSCGSQNLKIGSSTFLEDRILALCVCGYEKARGEICKFCSVSTEWEIKFNKIVSTWKEPEWVWQRHDLLIDYTSALIKTIKPFIHSLLQEEGKKVRQELLKELDNKKEKCAFCGNEINAEIMSYEAYRIHYEERCIDKQ